MFSTTTMPLSTNMPSARIKLNKTTMLSVKPTICRMVNDINIDSGIATPTNDAVRKPSTSSNIPVTRMSARDDVVLQAADHHVDVFGLVGGDGYVGAGRKVGTHVLDSRPDRLCCLDDVLAASLGHTEGHHRRDVEPGVAVPLLEAEVDRRHVTDVDRPSAPRFDHDVGNQVRGFELAGHADEVLQSADIDRAAGNRDVLTAIAAITSSNARS